LVLLIGTYSLKSSQFTLHLIGIFNVKIFNLHCMLIGIHVPGTTIYSKGEEVSGRYYLVSDLSLYTEKHSDYEQLSGSGSIS
jgi:hypothetical protein